MMQAAIFFNPSDVLLNIVIYPAIPLFTHYYLLLYYLFLSRQSFDKKDYTKDILCLLARLDLYNT
jgi:hypothetical protein